ncbi:glycosyltransferase involved in cell wall biosynthesis [Actinocorallia herbida]|uniref:Glycosyltransferase involved in cell wall biosynthesis n=1 Tax=Actinocorallia herbida TaxID=58109 RepID=A0A3N1CS25_9ACTN|nr:glycosyltransferase [Actinocorallia herbida]ROO84109.1 glycosyltransferase involved in cell wall biosynthesis [Actinocorallia herbida]
MDDVQGMRVALVLGLASGGLGRHVKAVAEGLAERGARVAVCGPGETERTYGFSGAGVRFAEVDIADRPRPAGDLAAVRKLRGLLRGADIVHAHGVRAGAMAVMARGRLASGGTGLRVEAGPPVLVTLHNEAPSGGMAGAAYAVLERIVARGATGVLGVSPDLEERMRALGARDVGHAIVPAPPLGAAAPGARERLREELGAGDAQVVLTVARLAPQKGLPVLLEAVSRMGPAAPLFLIAGDGPLDGELRERIATADLPVRLLGRRNDVAELLAACDIVAVPSMWEGQPLFVQEALRAGRPLVATATGGVPRLVGDAAVLVPAGDAAALAAALQGILSDPGRAVRLGAAAAQRATALPTDDDAVDQLAARYRGFLPG